MNLSLRDHCLRVSASATQEEFKTELVRFGRSLGFDTITALFAVDHADGQTDFFSVSHVPAAYLDSHTDMEAGKIDPVMQHCKHHHVPIVWDQATYVAQQLGPKWEHQAAFGYRCGVGVAMHMPGGLHFMVGADRDQPLPLDEAELNRMVASLHLFTAHAEGAARRVLAKRPDMPMELLSPRELETLRWTLAGKTAWEVGRILGIAENTVVRHTQRAAEKLGCRSKHHAAVKALRLGLIT